MLNRIYENTPHQSKNLWKKNSKNALRIKYLDRLSEQFVKIESRRIISTIILWKYVSHKNHLNPRILRLNRTMVLIFAKNQNLRRFTRWILTNGSCIYGAQRKYCITAEIWIDSCIVLLQSTELNRLTQRW